MEGKLRGDTKREQATKRETFKTKVHTVQEKPSGRKMTPHHTHSSLVTSTLLSLSYSHLCITASPHIPSIEFEREGDTLVMKLGSWSIDVDVINGYRVAAEAGRC